MLFGLVSTFKPKPATYILVNGKSASDLPYSKSTVASLGPGVNYFYFAFAK